MSDLDLLHAAVIDALAATGKNVGDGVAPKEADLPFSVCYGPWGRTDGGLDGAEDELHATWQVTSVGETPEQCNRLRQAVRDAMAALTADGVKVLQVRAEFRPPEREAQTHIEVAGVAVRPLFCAPDRYTVWFAPA